MSIRITDLQSVDREKWKQVWADCDYATFFHSPEWAEFWERYTQRKIQPAPLCVTFSDHYAAILPLSRCKHLKGLIKRVVSSPTGVYGGWISTDPLDARHGTLLADYLAGSAGNVRWRLNPFDAVVSSLDVADGEPDETHAVELSKDFDTIFKSWTKGHRAAVRQAEKYGISVRPAESIDDWHAYYRAYEDSLKRWGDKATVSYRWDLFHDMASSRSPHIRLWTAVFKNEVVAGALCFYAKRHVVYWHGAALERFLPGRPANLLMYVAIRDACTRGFKWFDFNPSGGLEGVKAFKKSFGAVAYPCPVVCVESSLMKLLKKIGKIK